jgi:outer membrane protein
MMKQTVWLLAATSLWAQAPLTLREAVQTALRRNPTITAAAEGTQAAASRVDQARGGRLPKLNYQESFARSDNPVFVFSSLLSQHQFGAENFNIGPLNRPDSHSNFQSQLTVDQVLYDGGQTRQAVKSAELGLQLTGEERRRAEMGLIATIARAYSDVVLAGESLQAAEQAVRSAEADLRRAEAVRGAGMSTDVDVLSIRVHLAAVTEQKIRRTADLDVARAALNDALGQPLDTGYLLTTGLTRANVSDAALDGLERGASQNRPETRQMRIATEMAQSQQAAARASLLPQVGVRAAWEADRERFVTRAGTNWLAAVSLRWNLFNGFSDKARIVEAEHSIRRTEAEAQRADSTVRLEVRRAWADLRAAEQRIEVAKAALAESEESLRITQNRYEAGMNGVTDLLRTETAVLESRTRYLAAVHDQRLAATMLELAAGRLTADSEVLN